MLRKLVKIFLAAILIVAIINMNVLQDFHIVEAATQLPENQKIEQLSVTALGKKKNNHYGQFLIDVGNRKGTLLIRIDPPKTAWNIQWVNWSISKPTAVNFHMHVEKDLENLPYHSAFYFSAVYEGFESSHGIPSKISQESGTLRRGLMKFSGYSNPPTYYAAMAIYLPEKYNNDGVYLLSGDQYALKEPGQVKAYFYQNVDVVAEAMEQVKEEGTFPLLQKVMWGKTELKKGQLGKVTVLKETPLLKKTSDGNYEKVRYLKPGEEYRVYRYNKDGQGYYGVGGGGFIKKDASAIKYETPSKKNLRLVEVMHGDGSDSFSSVYEIPEKENIWAKKIDEYKDIFPDGSTFYTSIYGFTVMPDSADWHIWHYLQEESYGFGIDDISRDPQIAAKVLTRLGVYKGKAETLENEIIRLSKVSISTGKLDNLQLKHEDGSVTIYWGKDNNYFR